jgi:TolA-binding protein
MKNDLEELSIAARRGELERADEQGLERLFDEAPDERIWHRAGLRFDAQDASAPSDTDLEGKLLQRLLAGQPSALPRPRRVHPVVLLAAAAVLVASAAAALVGIAELRQARTTPAENPSAARAGSASARPRAEPAPVSEPAPTPERSSETPATADVEADQQKHPRNNSEDLPVTAAELLSSAGQARRKGDAARAITLLEALQSRFPGSAEAQASDISLGMLRLQLGATVVALKDFDRYLGRSPSGDRAADALWGRSKALLALKRPGEAEKSLRQLLARYPESPFASAARAELRQLSP